MSIGNELHVVPTAKIVIPGDRQRQEHDESEDDQLLDSIQQHGLIHPIILRRDERMTATEVRTGDQPYFLVIGERRLRVWRQLERLDPELYSPGIPARFTDELDELELQEMELHENLRRKKLTWQEECFATLRIHRAWEAREDDWSAESTGNRLNCSGRHVGRLCLVAGALLDGDEQVAACEGYRAAAAILERRTKRKVQNELMEFEGVEADLVEDREPTDEELQAIEIEEVETIAVHEGPERVRIQVPITGPQGIRSAENDITVMDFREIAMTYDGPKFNFIHCDFPYGIGMHESDQTKTETRDVQYEDTEEIFWQCCRSLVDNADKLMKNTCHVMFWFPMKNYQAIRDFFLVNEFQVDPYPLVWIKSDKVGILPDPERGPRRIYETAFIMSRGDRRIIKPTVNGAHFPSEKRQAEHVSLKPYLVLSEFMTMFIDGDSEVLDPTCGTGTALAVATRKHAKRIIGWDIDEKAVEIAVSEVNSARLHMIAGAKRG